MIFVGTQKNNVDSVDFFCELERRELYYDVDMTTGEISISNIRPGTRNSIVKVVSKFFEISDIKTREDDINLENAPSEIDKALYELKKTLHRQGITEKASKKCIKNMILDVKCIKEDKNNQKFDVGEIVSCNFGFGIRNENNGYLNVVVLRESGKGKYYLVIPINLTDQYDNNNVFGLKVTKDIDAVYYNSNYKRKTATLYLNRIQEVDSARLGPVKVGRVTRRFIRKIYKALYLMDEENLSLSELLEDVTSAAVWNYSKGDTASEQSKVLLDTMCIPEEFTLLRDAFSIAISTNIVILKKIIPLIKEKHETYSEYKIKTKLREEFVTWFKDVYPDIFEEYEKVSLADVIKAVLNQIAKNK